MDVAGARVVFRDCHGGVGADVLCCCCCDCGSGDCGGGCGDEIRVCESSGGDLSAGGGDLFG